MSSNRQPNDSAMRRHVSILPCERPSQSLETVLSESPAIFESLMREIPRDLMYDSSFVTCLPP